MMARLPPSWEWSPLTPDRFADLEQLFGPKGAYGGCWCMYWRATRAQWTRNLGRANREAFREVVREQRATGVLGYVASVPVAWCAIAPREDYPTLERSPKFKRVDEKPVWSITCFYVAREWRGRGLMDAMIRAALAYARAEGASLVEAYPLDKEAERKLAPVQGYMGLASAFKRQRFRVVAEHAGGKVTMRRALRPAATTK